jgi:membrane-associated phospholipid phosphatase
VVGTVAGAAALKAVLVRPALLDGTANSLPSGHVAAVAGLAAALALVCAPTGRVLVAVAGLGAVATTGLATLALAWHRPSDVVASGLLAVGVAAVAGAVPGAGATRPPASTGLTTVKRRVPQG